MLQPVQILMSLIGNCIILHSIYAAATEGEIIKYDYYNDRNSTSGEGDSSQKGVENVYESVRYVADGASSSSSELSFANSEDAGFVLEYIDSDDVNSSPTNLNTVSSSTHTYETVLPSIFRPTEVTKSSHTSINGKETNLNPFAKAALSVPALQKYLKIKIPGSKAAVIFFNHAYNILKRFDVPNYSSAASEMSKVIAAIDVLTLPLFFQAIGNAMEKFLLLEEIEMLPTFPQTYASFIQNNLLSYEINGLGELYEALLMGKTNFLCSLVLCDRQKIYELYHLLRSEYKSLKNV